MQAKLTVETYEIESDGKKYFAHIDYQKKKVKITNTNGTLNTFICDLGVSEAKKELETLFNIYSFCEDILKNSNYGT